MFEKVPMDGVASLPAVSGSEPVWTRDKMARMRYLSFVVAVGMVLPLLCFGQIARVPTVFSVPPSDAPELARRGSYSVGVRTLQLEHAGQIDILSFDPKTGKAPVYNRPLPVEVWYPATLPAGATERTTYVSALPGDKAGQTMNIDGKALRDAAPVTGSRFPLVIVSHGYPGSRTFLTYLTENLASKGYVVAAIDHTDSVFGAVRGFASTLLNRSSDQLFTIQELSRQSNESASFLHGLVDTENVAVVGYSMGGYGALITGGAGLSKQSALQQFVPGHFLDAWTSDDPSFVGHDRKAIKAIVAIAPWGEQPPYSAWDGGGLAKLRLPALFVAGDHDDVADYSNGIKRIFEQAVNAPRYMLVYKEARHNTGANPPPPEAALDYAHIQTFDEPVWRKDRITAINQHFITAFLDLYLKGDRSRLSYLDVPMVESDAGQWTVPANTPDDGGFSSGRDAGGEPFWKGFQRRWAVGLEMFHQAPQSAAASPAP